jgi:serine/threonine protein kinase
MRIIMPSDSIVGFLQQVRSQQLLFPEQIEKLVQEPDWPQEGLERLCQYLLERGILTRYQAEALLQGRGQELNLGGYPVLEAIGPCPGGTVYKVLHPTLRLPLLLRRLRADEASLGEPAEAFFERVRQWGMWQHPHVVAALDVGRTDDDIYIVLDPLGDHADVETLTVELGGPMPGPVFQEMGRALASVLRSLHEQGGTHGRICPAHLVLGPLREKVRPDGSRSRRPASDATIKLTELGLLPRLPPVRQQPPPRQYLAYLPPEFFDDPTPTPAADIYALGATLYFLLTARPPFKGDDPATLMEAIAQAPLKPLARLRPDIPGEISALVERMLAREPGQRPTAAEVEQSLTSQTSVPSRSGSLPLADDLPESAPLAESVSSRHLPVAVPVQSSSVSPEPAADWSEAWSCHMAATAATEPPQRRARPITDAERARSRRMLLLGGLLHLTAVTLLLLWIFGAFTSSPEPEPTPPQKKENKIPPKTRPRNPQVG